MANQPSSWTDQHEEALLAMKALKVPEKEARKLLEGVPPGSTGDILRAALRARASGTKRPPATPGAPTGAVPLNPPAQPQSVAPAAPAARPTPPPAPISSGSKKPTLMEDLKAIGKIFLGGAPKKPQPPQQSAPQIPPPNTGATPGASAVAPGPAPQSIPAAQTPPAAPISPAAAQTQPGPLQKPRIRVRAAGRRIPAAPIGAQPQSKETPVMIHSYDEYEGLAPGAEFIWPNGHVYRKPAQA